MGRRGGRKGKKSDSKSADHDEAPEVEAEGEERVGAEEGNGGFFACYLLHSLSPRYKGHTYIGYTVNPRRRIRQHNGEMRSGAWRTKRKRPWEMVLCVYGFPTNVSALQFEWAWQHPRESLAVRKAAADFKSLSGVSNKIRLAYTMLMLPEWESLNLTVNFFSTKYMKHTACCPKLSENMTTTVSTMDELPCYVENPVLDNDDSSYDDYDDGFNRYGDTRDHEETSSLSMEQSTQNSFMQSERSQSPIQAKECPQVQKQIQPDNIEKVKKLYFYSSEMPIGDDFPSSVPCSYDSGCNSYDETSSGDGFLASNSCSSDGSSAVSDGLPVGDASFGRHNFDLLDRNTSSIRSVPKHDVIDLSTPPRCNFPSGKKQRSTGPQFIDLTESPLVIHL